MVLLSGTLNPKTLNPKPYNGLGQWAEEPLRTLGGKLLLLGGSWYLLANDNCTSNPLISPLSALVWL